MTAYAASKRFATQSVEPGVQASCETGEFCSIYLHLSV